MSTHSCTTSKYILCTHIHSYMNKDINIHMYKYKHALHMQVITQVHNLDTVTQ